MSRSDWPIFRQRLNALFDQGLPDGAPATVSEVARRAQAAGYQLSRPYVGQLRSGRAGNPALSTIEALAHVFEVEPNFFFAVRHQSGDAYEILATGAADPAAHVAGAGLDLDDEGRQELGTFVLDWIRSRQQAQGE